MYITTDIIAELYVMFNELNARYFNEELPLPFIHLQEGVSKKASTLGSFQANHYCEGIQTIDDNNAKVDINVTKNDIHSINISGEFLCRPIEELACTMLHEMVHMYCHEHNIRDTSNKGVYHNKRFAAECEARDLNVESADVVGYAYTTPTPVFADFVSSCNFNTEVFHYFIPVEIDDGEAKTSTKKRYVCPMCGMSLNAPKDTNIICGNCMKRMDYWDLTDENSPKCLADYNQGLAISDEGWFHELNENQDKEESDKDC